MRIVLQKVQRSWVDVGDKTIGEIADGLLLLVGITHGDTTADAEKLAQKVLSLRLFAEDGAESFMDKNVVETGGGILAVSQFTLYGDCKKGTKPSFSDAARPEEAEPLYHHFVMTLRESGIRVETGEFGAHMEVHLVNNGPITLILDSRA